MAEATKFVATPTAALYAQPEGTRRRIELLWGDRVQVLDAASPRWRVRARGVTGYVAPTVLGDTSLLEVYFIDVGQGDGMLIRFPDDRHVLVDGGYIRARQQTGRNAADFVDWKFVREYGRDTIVLDAIVSSHCDADHYGGLWDLLDPAHRAELDARAVEVKAFYHAGVSWWSDAGKRNLGPVEGGRLVRLLGGKTSLRTPLVYSTEISRSFRVGRIEALTLAGDTLDRAALDRANARVGYRQVNAGDLHPASGSRRLAGSYVVTGIVYGLVNVRTDGDTILCATLNEKNSTWDWASFKSRF